MAARIKICGLTQPAHIDALNAHAVELAGFVFFKASPRHLSYDRAAQLAARCRPEMERVALLVDADDGEIDAAIAAVSPHHLQLHGHETPQRVADIRRRSPAALIKALPVATAEDLAQAAAYAPHVDGFLFDAKPQPGGLPGGNGEAFDWTLLSAYDLKKPYLLAGGLSADNVAAALQVTGAPMVDVSSGVESAPGDKDPQQIAAFVDAVRTSAA